MLKITGKGRSYGVLNITKEERMSFLTQIALYFFAYLAIIVGGFLALLIDGLKALLDPLKRYISFAEKKIGEL